MGFIGVELTKFQVQKYLPKPAGGRPDGRPMCTRYVHRTKQEGRSTWRSTTESTPLSGTAGRPGGQPTGCARSTGRSIGGTTIKNMTIGPVDQRVISGCNG